MGFKEALEWFDDHHWTKGFHYSMIDRDGKRNSDCSSAIYLSFMAGGVLPKGTPLGNTETLFKLNGIYMDEIYSYKDVRPGDIFIRGGEGTSAGANGHTGMFYKKDGIVHSNYTNNGISYNDIDTIGYYLDRQRSWNERYFRPRYPGSSKPSVSKPKVTSRGKGKKFIKNENWHAYTQCAVNVRSDASTNSAIVATYPMGSRINYDSVYEGDGYRWISYIADGSKKRRYVAYRRLSGDTRPWLTF